jgi:hypothetical protein
VNDLAPLDDLFDLVVVPGGYTPGVRANGPSLCCCCSCSSCGGGGSKVE